MHYLIHAQGRTHGCLGHFYPITAIVETAATEDEEIRDIARESISVDYEHVMIKYVIPILPEDLEKHHAEQAEKAYRREVKLLTGSIQEKLDRQSVLLKALSGVRRA